MTMECPVRVSVTGVVFVRIITHTVHASNRALSTECMGGIWALCEAVGIWALCEA